MRKFLGVAVTITGCLLAGVIFVFQSALNVIGAIICVISSGR